ncbi:MAG: hypothetical protein ACM3YO_03710 [Bacteroidota bacterium]
MKRVFFTALFVLLGGTAFAAPLPTPTPTPSPGALPINGVSVQVTSPQAAPNANHVEVPPIFKKK